MKSFLYSSCDFHHKHNSLNKRQGCNRHYVFSPNALIPTTLISQLQQSQIVTRQFYANQDTPFGSRVHWGNDVWEIDVSGLM